MKRGRPPLPPERRKHARVVIHAAGTLEEDIRQYAEYRGKTVQEMTTEWWTWLTRKHSDLRVPQNRQDAASIAR